MTRKRQLLLTDEETAALYDHLVRYFQHLKNIEAEAQTRIASRGGSSPLDEEDAQVAMEAAKSVQVFTDRLAHGMQTYVEDVTAQAQWKTALISAAQTGQLMAGHYASQETITVLVGNGYGTYITDGPQDGIQSVTGFRINENGREAACRISGRNA